MRFKVVSIKERNPTRDDVYFIIINGIIRATAVWKNPHPRMEHGWKFDENDDQFGKPDVTHWLEEVERKSKKKKKKKHAKK